MAEFKEYYRAPAAAVTRRPGTWSPRGHGSWGGTTPSFRTHRSGGEFQATVGRPRSTGPEAVFLQLSWHLLSRLQHREQMTPLWKVQAAMSGRSKLSPQTTQVISVSDIRPSGVTAGGSRSSTRAM